MSGRAMSASRRISPAWFMPISMHAGAAVVGQAQQGERHADVIVEIADRLADRQFGLQQVRDGVLGRRLARAARHADHRSAPFLARPRGQVLQCALAYRAPASVRLRPDRPAKPVPLHHYRRRAFFDGGADEIRARRGWARAAQNTRRPAFCVRVSTLQPATGTGGGSPAAPMARATS